MFKFFWGKGSQQSVERLKIQKDLFQFQKTIQHGFPSKPAAVSWDPVLRLLCIGTKTGAVKLIGAPGVEFYGQLDKDKVINKVFFVPGQGMVIVVCEDNSLHSVEIDSMTKNLRSTNSISLEGKLKKISACCVSSDGRTLYIGTENGNVYSMELSCFRMSDSVIYLDIVMQNVSEDFKVNPGAVEVVCEQPTHPECILIGYSRGLLTLWNLRSETVVKIYIASQQLESAYWHPNGQKFFTAHNDGSYMIWKSGTDDNELIVDKQPIISTPYGPFPCKAITKIVNIEDEDNIIVFTGGMPRANYGDRYTLSVMKNTAHVTFDLSSKVVDFCLISEAISKETEALVVLAEEEFIVVDLITPGWPCHSSPYLASLHCSAVTAQIAVVCSQQLYEKLLKNPRKLSPSSKLSPRSWPINGGESEFSSGEFSSGNLMLLTGHEDGSVRFWDASSPSLSQISMFSTSVCFSSDELDALPNGEEVESEDEWPPFRRIGVFDPYSDDPRLAVKKLCFCPETGMLAVAGTAGQVIIAVISDTQIEKELTVINLNIVSDRDNFVWKGHDKLVSRKGLHSFGPGFFPDAILQLYPPASATALALQSDWSVLAVGTAHGIALFDVETKQGMLAKCTLNPSDISGVGDQAMSRRKSFKKSLRESFRRLRKGRSQRPTSTKKPVLNSNISKSEEVSQNTSGPSFGTDLRPIERQVEARSADDGIGSMIRCITMAKTYIMSQSSVMSATVWAGTNNGSVFVFNVNFQPGSRRSSETSRAQLAKEIQLKHRAPIVSVNVLDASNTLVEDALSNRISSSDSVLPHRVIISSEEQFKVFTLPNLRPFGKYKLTAYTGCKARRIAVIPYIAKTDPSYVENSLTCLCNQGDFHILSLPELRRQMDAQSIKKEDIHATSTAVFTRQGEAFYMLSSSEIQRISLSARYCPKISCHVTTLKAASANLAQELTSASVQKSSKARDSGTLICLETKSATVIEEQQIGKDRSRIQEAGNSTVVSVEPETSFGDLTLDSVKDHSANTEEFRSNEVDITNVTDLEVLQNSLSAILPTKENDTEKPHSKSHEQQSGMTTQESEIDHSDNMKSQPILLDPLSETTDAVDQVKGGLKINSDF
nr:EOG090X00I4 [Macrothrix elegans]